jgi:hypothetical protein
MGKPEEGLVAEAVPANRSADENSLLTGKITGK